MKRRLFARAFLILSCAVSLPSINAHAAAALPSCEQVQLSPDQREALADTVFKGVVTGTSCVCMPLASDRNSYGPKIECTDTIRVTHEIKGEVDPQITLKSFVTLDDNPNAVLSKGYCEESIGNRDDSLKNKESTYYLHFESGYYQTVPASACR